MASAIADLSAAIAGEAPDVPGAAVGDVGQHLPAEARQARLDGGEAGAQRIGAAELEGIEDHLTALAGAQPVRFDTPG